jgi:hypothetical protein
VTEHPPTSAPERSPYERSSVIEHGVILQDFSGVTDPADSMLIIANARRFMETQPRDGKRLVLTDVTGSIFNQEVVDAMKELAVHHRPWIRASALVGLSPLMRVVYRAIVALTRREIRVCESRTEAMAYLLAKAAERG